ncbi:protein TolR [Altererythrobacter confluentis]|uniref:Protein TolR n=1 Tax=Allopontixanthobacter confluentis TaxID=1849021 RepID=A0A6L7GIU6_9SPHN|nr:ExbD/TolR family protein [Allopontixanthobacter confluentis]MXP14818.1 protein TolR [Allopontixanthobacter confluentis]
MAMGVSGGSSGGARGRRGGARGGRRAPMAEINVTPFVDVMLVLLIIFMVTAPLLAAGVPIDLPESRANALAPDQDPVTVSIDGQGYIYLGEERLAVGELPDRLANIQPNPDGSLPQVTLRADQKLEYGRVMAVMGELNRSGFNAISLVTNGSVSDP